MPLAPTNLWSGINRCNSSAKKEDFSLATNYLFLLQAKSATKSYGTVLSFLSVQNSVIAKMDLDVPGLAQPNSCPMPHH